MIDRTESLAGRRRIGLLGLFFAALLPRAAIAVRRDTICSDAVFYLERADALARGDFPSGLADLGLNLYTLLLGGFASAGLDLEPTGRWLSVLAAALTVVPIAALTAEWFGRRAALIAGLLYACAPEPLDWSAEAIRDPLFWLTFAWGLQAAWRASSRGRLRDYLMWGAAFSAAALLRTEGLLLLLPLACWAKPSLSAALKLASGMTVWPACVVLINLGLLAAGHTHWEWGRLDHARIVARWTRAMIRAEPGASHAALPTPSATPTSEAPTEALSWRELSWGVRHNVRRGLGWPCLALALCGWLSFRGGWRISLAGALLSVALLLAMAIYFWQCHELTTRYVVPLLIVWLPWAGRGADVVWLASRRMLGERERARAIAALACAAALFVIGLQGLADGLGRGNESRALKQSLGRHLAARFGAGQTLLASENLERLVGYYAGAQHVKLPREIGGLDALDWLRVKQPRLVVLWTKERPERYVELLAGPNCLGYARQPLPDGFEGAVLLVRRRVLPAGGASTACQTATATYTSVASAGRVRGPRTARR